MLTVIVPVYNGEKTLEKLFRSLEVQKDWRLVREIIFVNDNSKDSTDKLIERYAKKSKYRIRVITHTKNTGLAYSYNEAIGQAKTDFFVLTHQDMILTDDRSFKKILAPLLSSNNVVASYPTLLVPYAIWKKYGFWEKCLVSRFVDTEFQMLTGKLDCFNKKVLTEKIGLFDNQTYRTSGEDSDIQLRIHGKKYRTIPSGVKVIHNHISENFSASKLLKKEAQAGETKGVLIRKYGTAYLSTIDEAAKVLFRPVIVLCTLIPGIQVFALVTILLYSIAVTWRIYIEERSIAKLLMLPLINAYGLLVYSYYFVRGMYSGRQKV